MMNTQFLLEILACPKCHGKLELVEKDDKPAGFCCQACDVVYPVEEEIPVMLVEKAIPVSRFMNPPENS